MLEWSFHHKNIVIKNVKSMNVVNVKFNLERWEKLVLVYLLVTHSTKSAIPVRKDNFQMFNLLGISYFHATKQTGHFLNFDSLGG